MAKFKKQKIFGEEQRRQFAKEYYKKHQKTVDTAIKKWKERKDYDKLAAEGKVKIRSNEDIFVSEIVYGTHPRGWFSKKSANASVAQKLYELKTGDTEWYDAYHNIANEEDFPQYEDLRRFNNKKATHIDYKFGDPTDETGKVLSYYDFGDPEIVLAKIFYKPKDGSPSEVWELRSVYDIGLR